MHYRRLGHEYKHEIPILITHYGFAVLHYSLKMIFWKYVSGINSPNTFMHIFMYVYMRNMQALNIVISVFIVLLDINYVEIN